MLVLARHPALLADGTGPRQHGLPAAGSTSSGRYPAFESQFESRTVKEPSHRANITCKTTIEVRQQRPSLTLVKGSLPTWHVSGQGIDAYGRCMQKAPQVHDNNMTTTSQTCAGNAHHATDRIPHSLCRLTCQDRDCSQLPFIPHLQCAVATMRE